MILPQRFIVSSFQYFLSLALVWRQNNRRNLAPNMRCSAEKLNKNIYFTFFRMNSLLEISTTALKTFLSSSCKVARFSLTLQPSPRAETVKFINPDWPTNAGDFCVGNKTQKNIKKSIKHTCLRKFLLLASSVTVFDKSRHLYWDNNKNNNNALFGLKHFSHIYIENYKTTIT